MVDQFLERLYEIHFNHKYETYGDFFNAFDNYKAYYFDYYDSDIYKVYDDVIWLRFYYERGTKKNATWPNVLIAIHAGI